MTHFTPETQIAKAPEEAVTHESASSDTCDELFDMASAKLDAQLASADGPRCYIPTALSTVFQQRLPLRTPDGNEFMLSRFIARPEGIRHLQLVPVEGTIALPKPNPRLAIYIAMPLSATQSEAAGTFKVVVAHSSNDPEDVTSVKGHGVQQHQSAQTQLTQATAEIVLSELAAAETLYAE